MTENQSPETPDWTPEGDQHPTAEVPLADPGPVTATNIAPANQTQRRWLVPAGIGAGALLAGMLGGAISATIIADNDHGHGPPPFSQSNGQFPPGLPGQPGSGQPGLGQSGPGQPVPPAPEGGQSDQQQGTQQD